MQAVSLSLDCRRGSIGASVPQVGEVPHGIFLIDYDLRQVFCNHIQNATLVKFRKALIGIDVPPPG